MTQNGMSMSDFRGVDIEIENNFFFDVESYAASLGVDPKTVTEEMMINDLKSRSVRELLNDWNFQMGMTIYADSELIAHD